jgi:hypothetical protein
MIIKQTREDMLDTRLCTTHAHARAGSALSFILLSRLQLRCKRRKKFSVSANKFVFSSQINDQPANDVSNWATAK